MTSNASNIDYRLRAVGEFLEGSMRRGREVGLPQFNFFTLPVYKACAEKVGNVAATGISFLVADLVLHQALPQLLTCYVSVMSYTEGECNPSYYYPSTLVWGTISLPIMYAKHRRNQTHQSVLPR